MSIDQMPLGFAPIIYNNSKELLIKKYTPFPHAVTWLSDLAFMEEIELWKNGRGGVVKQIHTRE